MSRLRAVDVLAYAWVNQTRKHTCRVHIGKGHLVCNGLLDDAGDGCVTSWDARRSSLAANDIRESQSGKGMGDS